VAYRIDQLVEEAKNFGKPRGPCPRCGKAEAEFKYHDCRERKLRVIFAGFVDLCVIILRRWKCQICGRTFTHYPEFVIPHKRYILGAISGLSQEYVEEPRATYRGVVHPEGQAFGYAPLENGDIDERQLSHSTLWEWLGWLGSLEVRLGRGLELLRQKEAAIHRLAIVIPPWKYQSEERRKLLEAGALLLEVAPIFQTVFGCSIFSGRFPKLSNMIRAPAG